MKRYIAPIINKHFLDFNPVAFGFGEYKAGSGMHTTIRKYTLIHYVVSGKGTLTINGVDHDVSPKQIFVVPTGHENSYKADKVEPWSYIWIGFDGRMSERFSNLAPVLDFHSNLFFEMMNVENMLSMQEEYLAQMLFKLYITLFQGVSTTDYVKAAKNLIETNYMDADLSVERISTELNLERSHLTRLFKEKTGVTVRDYLLSTRMSAAISLLKKGENVQSTSRLVGYSDPFVFSKAFKKHVGTSPVSYRTKK